MQRACPWQLHYYHHMGISRLEACSTAADIYSAGVLLAEVVTGMSPVMAVGVGQTDGAEYRLSVMQQAKHQVWVSCFECLVSSVSPQGHLIHLSLHLFMYILAP